MLEDQYKYDRSNEILIEMVQANESDS